MIALTVELVPVLVGIVASPLAIMALVAVLLSRHARRNGVMYLLGWALAVVISLALASLLLGGAEVGAPKEPPTWVGVVRLLLAVVLTAGALWTYRRSRASLRAMAAATTPEQVAAAAPQLPGWLRAVGTFKAGRSLLLGAGIFLLNPINVSCAVIAALDILQADLQPPAASAFLVSFAMLSIVPMAVPVVLVLTTGERATAVLERLRGWIADHNGLISAAFMLMVAFGQLQKAVQSWG